MIDPTLRAGTGRPLMAIDAVWMAIDAVWMGLLAAVGLTAVLWEVVTERRRRRAMQALAQRCQFAWLGEELPKDCPPDLTDDVFPWIKYGGPDQVGNAVGGMHRQDYRLCFDLRVSTGRGHVDATVVAVLSSRIRPEPAPHPAYVFCEEGQWRMVSMKQSYWHRRGRIPPEAIEAIWEALT